MKIYSENGKCQAIDENGKVLFESKIAESVIQWAIDNTTSIIEVQTPMTLETGAYIEGFGNRTKLVKK